MTREEYEKYINSNEWRIKRQKRLEIDKYQCRLCGETGETYRLEVHHKPESYARIPNESVEDDLTTVCARCHDAITDIIRRDRYGNREYTVETIKVSIERKISDDVETSKIQVDLIGPADNAQRAIGRPAQQVGKVDETDFLKEEKGGLGLRGNGPA